MKKLLCMVVAAAMALSMSAVAFAAGSVTEAPDSVTVERVEADGDVSVPSTVTSGKVTFNLEVSTVAGKTVAETEAKTMTTEKLVANVASIDGAEGLNRIVDVASATPISSFNLKADRVPTAEEPLVLTFSLPKLKANQRALVFHQKKDKSWELVGTSKAGASSVKATFTSLSPVTIMVADVATAASETPTDSTPVVTAPNTGAASVAAALVAGVL